MMTPETMWKERRSAFWNEAILYLRLMGNSGFMFSVYVAFLLGAYYYSVLLRELSPEFPSALVTAAVLTFYLTRSPIRTFVKPADLVFLLPMEQRLDPFFQKAIHYSFMVQGAVLLFVLFLLSPFYFDRIDPRTGMFALTVIVAFAVKYWNVTGKWNELHLQHRQPRYLSLSLRTAANFLFFWLLFRHASFYLLLALAIILLLIYVLIWKPVQREHPLKWERLLEAEAAQSAAFYRMANMFTDVPQLKNRIKPRRLLSGIVRIPFRRTSVFSVYYYKTFVRSGDFFGVFMRLLIVGAALLWVLPAGWMRIVVFLLLLYMSGLQLFTMWKIRTGGNWEALYPVSFKDRKRSFLRIVVALLLLQALVYEGSLILGGEGMRSLISFALGIAFVFWFAGVHLNKKIEKET